MMPTADQKKRGPDRRVQHWRLDKKLNIGQLVTLTAAIIAGIMVYSDLDKKVEVNRIGITYLTNEDARANVRVEKELATINQKLDRMYQDMLAQARQRRGG